MIDYHTFCEIHRLGEQEHLSLSQVATRLHLAYQTVEKWARDMSRSCVWVTSGGVCKMRGNDSCGGLLLLAVDEDDAVHHLGE